MILLIGVAVIVFVLLGRAVIPAYRRYRRAAELRHDWWPRFERELREYMSHTWRSARDAERHL